MLKSQIKLEKFEKALESLKAIYLQPIDNSRIHIDATIQRFEFTFELAWKFLKNYLQDRGLNLYYPKDVLKEAFIGNIIDNEDTWIQMLNDRNMTSHTYNEQLANEIFIRIRSYVPELIQLLQRVRA